MSLFFNKYNILRNYMMTNQNLTTDIGTLTPYLHTMLVIHSQALFCVVNDFKALHVFIQPSSTASIFTLDILPFSQNDSKSYIWI